MDDLIAFLRARLDDDEQTARAVEDGSAPWDGQWAADGPDALRTRNGHVLAYGHRSTDGRDLPMPLKPGLVEHWARHDPARVLAEVDAKRKMVALHEPVILHAGGGAAHFNTTRVCRSCEPPRQFPETAWPCPTVRLLALPYADHPDYDDTWRP